MRNRGSGFPEADGIEITRGAVEQAWTKIPHQTDQTKHVIQLVL